MVATNYFTKWVEAILARKETSKVMIDFITNNILTRFGCQVKIVSDNAMSFRSEEYEELGNSYGIQISYSSPYHP